MSFPIDSHIVSVLLYEKIIDLPTKGIVVIDLSLPENQHVSARNSIAMIDFVVSKIGSDALPSLFKGVLEPATLVSKTHFYRNQPINLAFFQNIENWFTSEMTMELFQNLEKMGCDCFDVGYHSVKNSNKVRNVIVTGMMQAIGPKRLAERANEIIMLYNRTKVAQMLEVGKDYLIAKLTYKLGFKHDYRVTLQNAGCYVAGFEATGLQNVQYEVLEDDYSAESGKTIIKFTWQQKPLVLRAKETFGMLIANTFAKSYLKSHHVVESYHSDLIDSLHHEISQKDKAAREREEYFRQLSQEKLKKQSELEQLVAERTEQLNQALEELEEALADNKEMLQNFSHEMRTPLTMIIGPIEALINSKQQPSERQIELAHRNCLRLQHMTEQLSRLEKIKNVSAEDYVSIELSEVAGSLAESFGFRLSQLGEKQFDYAIDKNLWVKASADALLTIVENLLSNADKYSNKGDSISLTLKEQSGSALLTVTDTGIGIAPEQHTKVFERFQRVAGSQNIFGVGIGLAIVKQQVEALGGSLTLKSQLGEGSCFQVQLPLTAPMYRASQHTSVKPLVEPEKLPVLVKPSKGEYQILVVDDSHDLCDALSELLSPIAQVTCAHNGQAGFQTISKRAKQGKSFDIILSDINMPEMDGLELLKQLKANEQTSHIPVLLISAKSESADIEKGLDLGAIDYITKPFSRKDLFNKINNLTKLLTELKQTKGRSHQAIKDPWLARLEQVMEKHYHDFEFSVLKLAKEMGVSERSLLDKIKASLGIKPTEYIQSYRMDKAAELLSTTTVDNLAIANSVGIKNASSFSTAFKKYKGKSPTEFRK